MSFLTPLIEPVLNWALKKVSLFVASWILKQAQKNEIEKINTGIKKKILEAQTKEERERAVENSASHF